jgi:hypothetical protein
VAWFRDHRGSFYRGRGGHWRGDRREEEAPSMAAGMGADGASVKGNDASFRGERGRRGCSSPCGEGGRRPTWRWWRQNERRWRLRGRSGEAAQQRRGRGSGPSWRGRRLGTCWAGSIKKAEALLGRRGMGRGKEAGCTTPWAKSRIRT